MCASVERDDAHRRWKLSCAAATLLIVGFNGTCQPGQQRCENFSADLPCAPRLHKSQLAVRNGTQLAGDSGGPRLQQWEIHVLVPLDGGPQTWDEDSGVASLEGQQMADWCARVDGEKCSKPETPFYVTVLSFSLNKEGVTRLQ